MLCAMSADATSARTAFDDSRWPIVVATLPPTPLDRPGFEEHCAKLFSYFEREQSFAWIFDARNAAPLSATQRRIIAEMTDHYTARYPQVKCVVAVVLSSAVQRGIVKAINWLMQRPVPTEIFGTLEEAIAWSKGALRAGVATDRHAAI